MRKKICFIIATPLTAKAFLMKHFEYLSEIFDIYVVANFDQNPGFTLDNQFIKGQKNIEIARSISLLKDGKALFELRKYLHEMQFDAVHSVTPKAGLIGMLAAKLAGVKIRVHIFTGQVWHTQKGFFKILLKNLDRLIVFCATNILVDGKSQRRFLIENKIINDKNSQVLGEGSISGVDTAKFFPQPEVRAQYRSELHLNDEIVYLFLGRMNRDKGILDLAKAFCVLHEKFPKTKLVLVGPDEENLEPLIRQMDDTNGDIVFYGSTPKPQDVLQLADVFCLPSYREGFGTSVIEASLLELPIICSDTYGLMETIVENQTGLRHKTRDVASILAQMEHMTDLNSRKRMGENGRQYVLQNFSAEKISTAWLGFYKGLLQNKNS